MFVKNQDAQQAFLFCKAGKQNTIRSAGQHLYRTSKLLSVTNSGAEGAAQ